MQEVHCKEWLPCKACKKAVLDIRQPAGLGHKELPPLPSLPLEGPRLATCSGVSQQWCVQVRAVEHYTAAGPAQHTKQASGSEHGAQPVQPAGCVVTVVA